MPPSESDALRDGLLASYAHELSLAYIDARQRHDAPVLLLVDADDSLGKKICEQHKLKDPINILSLTPEEGLELLSDSSLLEEKASTLLHSFEQEALRVIVIAYEGASLHAMDL